MYLRNQETALLLFLINRVYTSFAATVFLIVYCAGKIQSTSCKWLTIKACYFRDKGVYCS